MRFSPSSWNFTSCISYGFPILSENDAILLGCIASRQTTTRPNLQNFDIAQFIFIPAAAVPEFTQSIPIFPPFSSLTSPHGLRFIAPFCYFLP